MTYLIHCRCEGIGSDWKSITAAVEKVLEGA